jgi:hypothetical protein
LVSHALYSELTTSAKANVGVHANDVSMPTPITNLQKRA